MTIYILAGSYLQARIWCLDNGFPPPGHRHRPIANAERGDSPIFISGPNSLLGRVIGPGDEVVAVGTWFDRPDLFAIGQAIATAKAKGPRASKEGE